MILVSCLIEAVRLRKEGKIEQALESLLMAGNSGNSVAMFHLADAYFICGWSVRVDRGEAARWSRRAAECGNGSGMALYAECLNNGFGLKKDVYKGSLWAQKALAADSFFARGYCHYNGLGTVLDFKKAMSCFVASSEQQGDEYGQYLLAEMFSGQGEDEKALFWFEKSGSQGFAWAQFMVGQHYHNGSGCVQNFDTATMWYEKAASQGITRAINARRKIESTHFK